MKTIQLHISLFFILIWSFSYAQVYENYTTKNGLPSNHIYRITQDYQGFIWIITNKGISKFDGKNFKNFTTKEGLPSNDIWHIGITPDNKIWYFSKANKLGYIKNDKVFAFPSKRNKVLYPRNILQAKNTIGFNDGDFYYTLKDTLWETTPNIFNSSAFIKQKVIHPIINYHSINKNRDSIILYKKETKIKFPVKKELFQKITEHGQINDSLYLHIFKHFYIIENFNSEKITTFSLPNLSYHNLKHLRYHNVNNQIQFTGMNFVSYLSTHGTLKNTIHVPKKLNSHFSFIDKTGNIWSATFNKGVFLLPKEKKHVQIIAKDKKIQQLQLIKNDLYTGIYKEGFFKIKDTLQLIIKNNSFQYSINDIDDLQITFFSSEHDIHHYKNKKTTTLNILKETPNVNTFARKLIRFKGDLYGNNSFGICKIEQKKFTAKKSYKLFGVSSFSKTGTQLFTGNQSGLFLLKNDEFIKLNTHSLFKKPILCQKQLNNNYVVVGTDGYGAYITDGNIHKFIKNSKNYSVQNIFIDKRKNIWLATNEGVHKVQKQNKEYKIIESFYESDGLTSNNINCVVVKNDSLYAGTNTGISILPLKQFKTNQLQALYIKSIKNETQNFKGDTITFSYKNNNFISVSFGTIYFNNQQNLKYQYALNPIQKEWIDTNTPNINFTDLKPNTYSLHLKVINHHKRECLKTIVIQVLPLWYQTWVFKVFLSVFFLIIFYLVNKWNQKRIKKIAIQKIKIQQKLAEQELHALRSQMNPHFVFNSLNAIQYYITKNEIDLSEKYLVKFSRLIRMFFDFSAEKTITIDQEIKLLKGYLEIEKMRFGNEFFYHFLIDKPIKSKSKIPTMLLQPIVENAVNHGVFHNNRKGNIYITFTFIDKNTFKVIIEDDGIGIQKSEEIKATSLKKHHSKSTKIIKERIDLINQSKDWHISQEVIDLTQQNKNGTKVTLSFKKLI